MLAVASIQGLKHLEAKPQLLETARNNARLFHKAFGSTRHAILEGAEESPAMHLRLTKTYATRSEEDAVLQKIVEHVRLSGVAGWFFLTFSKRSQIAKDRVAVTRAKYIVDQEQKVPKPSIRIFVSAGHSAKELEKAAKTIRKSVESVCS